MKNKNGKPSIFKTILIADIQALACNLLIINAIFASENDSKLKYVVINVDSLSSNDRMSLWHYSNLTSQFRLQDITNDMNYFLLQIIPQLKSNELLLQCKKQLLTDS